ncbi:tachylectin-related carbohydrate-binding protein [Crenothrix sp.]|uniref:tachylectin-related carbohydrate-binding protein n=1 Tax=Crenothrix sp. TaxID=3100433 RepID=UPI00374D1307
MKHPNNASAAAKVASCLLLLLYLTTFLSLAHASQSNNYAAFGNSNGDIYTLANDGKLRWFQHTDRMVGKHPLADNQKAKIVGDMTTLSNWSTTKVIPANEGVIYLIDNKGQLLWSRYDSKFTGSQQWLNPNKMTVIGNGWQNYQHVFSGGDGVIYALTTDGNMRWFRHTGWQDGSNKWAAGSGKQISKGWQGTAKIFSGGDGVIYSIIKGGRLRWHRHLGRLTGEDNWSNKGIHKTVGFNWQNFRHVFSSGDGVIYGTTSNGDLAWHRHNGWLTGMDLWARAPQTNASRVIANGLSLH